MSENNTTRCDEGAELKKAAREILRKATEMTGGVLERHMAICAYCREEDARRRAAEVARSGQMVVRG